MSTEKVQVPDIGADNAEVIEILVSVGDNVEVDQSLAVLESDKASLEMPCPMAGKILSIAFSVGDQVSEGTLAIELEVTAEESAQAAATEPSETPANLSSDEAAESTDETTETRSETQESTLCLVPDIGAEEAEIIELAVSVGDRIEEGDSVVVAESDKASLEIPAEFDGVVDALHVSTGDKVSQGDQLVTIARSVSASPPNTAIEAEPKTKSIEPPVLEDLSLIHI